MKLIIFLFAFIAIVSCTETKENDRYKIFNTVLKEKVSTYGIMVNYLPLDRKYSDKEFDFIIKKKSDSLVTSKSLSYFINPELTILDTINPHDEFLDDHNSLLIHFRPKLSKNKIDFSKIKNLEIGKRSEKEIAINENQKYPTYLGSYDLSEPVFISKDKAVIRYQHYCGSKCGLGILIYLKKDNEIWKIVTEKEIWIS